MFATPFASSRSRAANANLPTGEMRRGGIFVAGNTIATYAWGDPLSQPYVLLVHGWSSFALRFSPWVSRLRAAGFAVVTFDQPGHVVHDMDDREVPWGDGELYARHWYNSRLLTTQGLGHHEVVDAPEVIDATLAFLRGARIGERVVGSPNLPLGLA